MGSVGKLSIDEAKRFILDMKEAGATRVAVGDISVQFGQEVVVSSGDQDPIEAAIENEFRNKEEDTVKQAARDRLLFGSSI
jgi:hypothetical protein